MSGLQVTWWELEELTDHFHQYPRYYEFHTENLILRTLMDTNGDIVPWYGIALMLPSPVTKYSMATIQISKLHPTERPDLVSLLLRHTSFGIRYQMTEALTNELKLDDRTATAMGIGLAHIALASAGETSTRGTSVGEASEPLCDAMPSLRRVHHLIGGGYVSLAPGPSYGLVARINVPCVTGGFLNTLSGVVRNGSSSDVLRNAYFGLPSTHEEHEPSEVQLELAGTGGGDSVQLTGVDSDGPPVEPVSSPTGIPANTPSPQPVDNPPGVL